MLELRKEIGEKTFTKWGIDIINTIQQNKILQQDVHGCILGKAKLSKVFQKKFKGKCKVNKQIPTRDKRMPYMWKEWKPGCSSQRREPNEQYRNQLNGFMQELSYENTSPKEFLQDMWRANEGIGILQQALSKIQEIWGCEFHKVQQCRIRRLTPRECLRLQGVSDEVTDKLIAAGISDTQMYRGAGDACTTNVIYEIAKRMK